MAERRRNKRRKDEEFEYVVKSRTDKPTRDEITVAKWMKKNVPIKKTKFAGHNVEYFTGSKAVDALMKSKWGTSETSTPYFPSRDDAAHFLDVMLRHKFFHRAKKVPVSEEELKAKMRKKKPFEEDRKKKDEETAESSHAEGRETEDKSKQAQDERQKKCRKIKLEMHYEQVFVDNLDAYVWIYDPIPVHYWLIGTLIVLGGIAICIFPLWPPQVRMCVQYLSIAAAGFLVLILVLAVLRLIVFCIVWLVTAGRLHFWLLPNLTEDVGFLASFWPLFQYKYMPKVNTLKANGEKAKESGSEEKGNEEADEKKETGKQIGSADEMMSLLRNMDFNVEQCHIHTVYAEDNQTQQPGRNGLNDSETDTESSGKQSQTGKDFEIIENEEADEKP